MKSFLKTAILLTALTLLLIGIGQYFGGRQGAMVAFGFALVMNLVTYWFSDKIVLAMYRAKPVTEAEAPNLYRIVREIAHRAQIPLPKLYVVQTETPNAFATGRSPKHAAVAVTSGILRILDEEELKGVLAHELGHVRNRDTLIMCVAAAIAGAIAMIARMAQWSLWMGGRNRGERRGNGMLDLIALLALIIVAPLAAALIQLAISRSREFGADETGARTTGNPHGLANALMKLDQAAKALPLDANPATAHLFIVNPLSAGAIAGLFSTHPPIQERIRRLREIRL
ncbi:MAG: zinc metalloprotease HtpX [Candidatus Omnitrophica bacterium]|nr:zinc metalloprotease HtpX [Candidatus Omnitrophota bacterium]